MKIIVKIDQQADAWNWWNACNQNRWLGIDWKERTTKRIQKELVKKSQQQANRFLYKYFQTLYKRMHVERIQKERQKKFDKVKDKIVKRMEAVTGKKMCRETVTVLLTTFPRAPYFTYRGLIWSYVGRNLKDPVSSLIHELLHFQTEYYFKKQLLKKISERQFEDLKEAITVVLNDSFRDLMPERDRGYADHVKLRADLLEYWGKNKDFSKLVQYGAQIVAQQTRK